MAFVNPHARLQILFLHLCRVCRRWYIKFMESFEIDPASISQPPIMATNLDTVSPQAPAKPAQKQEKLDEALQFDEANTFSAEPAPTKGAFASVASDSDEDGDAIKQNPFLDPDVAEHWSTVYEKAEYECRHVFDPTLTWSEEEERKLVRRLDWRVCLWAVS